MKVIPNDRQIYVTARAWHEIWPKLQLQPFIFGIHEGIDLSKYGNSIIKFYFTFIVVQQDDNINLPYAVYDEKKQEVDLAIQIPYTAVLNATDSGVLKLMEHAYIEGIETLRTFELESPFDIDQFKKDVEAIFAQDKWHEKVMKAA